MPDSDCKCGPFWLPMYFKRILSKKFNGACKKHDDDYRLQNKSKIHADSDFLNNMLLLSNSWWDVAISFLMFLSLKTPLGILSWYKSKIEHFFIKKEVSWNIEN